MLIGYSTLYRFAVEEVQFGQAAATIPILDGPGHGTGTIIYSNFRN